MLKRLGAILLVLSVVSLSSLAPSAFAQKKEKTPAERSIAGVVSDASGAPIAGAVVQLKNMKTLQVRSFLAKDKGDYYFHGLSTDVDYEVKAESNGRSSATRTLSTFDSHTEATFNLTVK